MNGASAEPPAITRKDPINAKTTIIGTSQYFLLYFIICQNSLKTLDLVILIISLVHFFKMADIALTRVIGAPVRGGG